jgi:hypothetical protein
MAATNAHRLSALAKIASDTTSLSRALARRFAWIASPSQSRNSDMPSAIQTNSSGRRRG